METDLRYPIGKFQRPSSVSATERNAAIDQLAALPAQIRKAVEGLTDAQLDTPYRPEGWTVRQVIHHLADSHMNSFTRFRLGLTEDQPTIKPYDEMAWSQLDDSLRAPIEVSIVLLENLHQRLVWMLRSITEEQWPRIFIHPENGPTRLDVNALLYAWHGRHHLGHITGLRERMGW